VSHKLLVHSATKQKESVSCLFFFGPLSAVHSILTTCWELSLWLLRSLFFWCEGEWDQSHFKTKKTTFGSHSMCFSVCPSIQHQNFKAICLGNCLSNALFFSRRKMWV
jgi:hypothetical protein